jgi:outer membrane protein OmpA-like peptidoglycan-associated protein
MSNPITFEADADLLGETKPSPAWQAAWRFARQLHSHGFLPRKHFIDRIAERALGGGIRFDPRMFRTEFDRAEHYRQTRSGYNTRIAVVRGVPILYRTGGQRGNRIVLTGALAPDTPLPPSERIASPGQQEMELVPEVEGSNEELRRHRGAMRSTPRWGRRRPPWRPPRPWPLYDPMPLTWAPTDDDGTDGDDVNEVLRVLETELTSREQEEQEWEEEIKRGSPEHVAWIQHSLNQLLGLRLKVDGMIGTATRNAIRSFQQRNGLTMDGVVGPNTQQRLVETLLRQMAADPRTVCAGFRQPELLDRFDFDGVKVKPFHVPQIVRIAQCIVALSGARQQIPPIRLVGHTDPVGNDAYNLNLGQRRAEAVRGSIQEHVDLLRPGLGSSLTFALDSRGELQPISPDAARNRRVEILFAVKPPPQPRGCPPFTARVRLHLKILQTPTLPIATMISNMRQVYGAAGFLVEVASTEHLNIAHLVDLDVGGQNGCRSGLVTGEQQELFSHRNNVGGNEIAVYFVRSTDLPLNGCAAHPPGRPSAVVTQIASQWTLAHEVGHVLDLNHVASEACDNATFVPTRLMTGCGTGLLRGTPTLIASEVATMDLSELTITC